MAVKDWSTTASSNTGILTGLTLDGAVMTPPQVDNAFRDMAAQIASQLGKMGFEGADIASAATTNLANATGWSLDITGTTTITGFGTVDAGQLFILRFTGALTLTHNATSLILPGAANITTTAGDVAWMKSEGSGNWRCVNYQTASGGPLGTTPTDGNFLVGNGTAFVGESGATARASMGLVSSTTDNAIIRADGTTGGTQNSGVIISDVNAITGLTGLTLSGATPDINFTDTDTNADCRISANSALGGLIIQADVNNEVASTTIAFQIDGGTKVTFNASGDIAATTATFAGAGTFGGTVTSSERFVSSSADAVVANNGSGSIIFRPNGQGSGAGSTIIDNNGDMAVLGDVTATNFITTSDASLKHDIRPLDGAGAVVDAVSAAQFAWNENDAEEFGFIADDFEKIAPHAVVIGKDGIKRLKPMAILAILWNAVREKQ